MLELQRLVVETDGLVQLSAQMMDKSHREVCLSIGGVQTDTLFKVTDSVLVLLKLAASVGQVREDSLHDPEGGIRVAERKCLKMVLFGLFVVL